MIQYLLDSNAVVHWLNRVDRGLILRMKEREQICALSAIGMHELYFGAFNSDRPERNLSVYDELRFPILSFDFEDARVAGEVRAVLKRVGTPIGPYDLLIAGQALARDLTLVTNNIREFGRVEGLKLEDWTA